MLLYTCRYLKKNFHLKNEKNMCFDDFKNKKSFVQALHNCLRKELKKLEVN